MVNHRGNPPGDQVVNQRDNQADSLRLGQQIQQDNPHVDQLDLLKVPAVDSLRIRRASRVVCRLHNPIELLRLSPASNPHRFQLRSRRCSPLCNPALSPRCTPLASPLRVPRRSQAYNQRRNPRVRQLCPLRSRPLSPLANLQ